MFKRLKMNKEIKELRQEYYELSGGYRGFSKNERARNYFLAHDTYDRKEAVRADKLLSKLDDPGIAESKKFEIQTELGKISKRINLTKLNSYNSNDLKLYDEFLEKVSEIKSKY